MAVIDGTSRLRKVLMCRPDFLVSAAPINVISEQYTEPLDHDKMMQEYGAVVKDVASFYWLYRVGRVCRVFSVWSV